MTAQQLFVTLVQDDLLPSSFIFFLQAKHQWT